MKVLILGASGMAGHTIALYLKEQGYSVTAFTRSEFSHCHNVRGDATNENDIVSVITSEKFDYVINCIGVLNQDCDKNPSRAVYLNSYLPHFIAELLKKSDTKLLQMSTDCVFSGYNGPYSEESFKDGETFYDRTKALGEVSYGGNLTFRNSIIGPDMNKDGIGLLNWFLKQNQGVKGYSKAIWTGVTTLTLAKAMEKAMRDNLSGLYNLVNNESISKYELLLLFNKHLKNNEVIISKDEEFEIDKTLVNNRKDFSFVVPSYEQMIIEMGEWIYQHKELYPHYETKNINVK